MKELNYLEKDISKISQILKKGKGSFKTRGWFKRKRELKNKIFFILFDETSELQCVVDRDKALKDLIKDAEKVTIQSSVELEGQLKKDERAPDGFELQIKKMHIVGLAQDFPIGKDLSTEFLMDVRHLWLRSAKMRDALKVRATVFDSFRKFMEKENVVETQGAMFVSGSVEGGSTLFEVPYFGKKAFLTQSSQFYLEVLMHSLGKVYTIAPSFRAEKSKTRRHLTEFWHAEVELPWAHLEDIIDFEERMIKFMVKTVVEKNSKELKALGRNTEDLMPTIEQKFHRKKYKDVVKDAMKKFSYLKHGSDLGEKEEREITKSLKKPLIITHYPDSLKPFYHRRNPDNPKEILCNDILAPEGFGEIIGSGERVWNEKKLVEQIKKDKLNPEDYQWYVDLRKFGSVPRAGFGMGLDRFTAWIVNAEHIRDVIPLPRTMNRIAP